MMQHSRVKAVSLLVAILVAVTALVAVLPGGPPASASFVVSSSGWGWQNPVPQGNDLRAVWGTSSSDVFAVGNRGTILHYNGFAWHGMDSGTSSDLQGVWGASSKDVFAVGSGGTIIHYNGDNWTAMTINPSTSVNIYDVWGSANNNVFAAGAGGTILRFQGGAGWVPMNFNENVTAVTFNGIWGSAANSVFAVGSGGYIASYDGNGSNDWVHIESTLTTQTLEDVWGASGQVFAVGASGIVVHRADDSWHSDNAGTSAAFYGVWQADSGQACAVGGAGVVRYYDGASWGAAPGGSVPSTTGLYGVWGTGSGHVFAVGSGGAILHYDGSTWTAMGSSVTTYGLNDVWGASATDVYAVGGAGTILHYDGSTWSSMTSNTSASLYGIWGISGSNVFAVGAGGIILHYDGVSWIAMNSNTSSNLYDVHGYGAGRVFAVGGSHQTSIFEFPYCPTSESGVMLRFDGIGSDWVVVANDFPSELSSVWVHTTDNVFAAGKNWSLVYPSPPLVGPPRCRESYAIYASNGASGYTNLASGSGLLYDIWGYSDTMFAVGTGGLALKTTDHFVTTEPTSTNYAGDLEGVWGTGTNRIFAAGSDGSILKYNGTDWSSEEPPCDKALYGVWCTGSESFAVGAGGAILHCPETPSLSGPLVPDYGGQGSTMDVTLNGEGLGAVTHVDFGEGITVNSFAVHSDNQMAVNITIDRDAATGDTRQVTVRNAHGTSNSVGFSVRPLPIIDSITPPKAGQNSTATVTIAGQNLLPLSSVALGDGITVNQLFPDTGNSVRASITVSDNATPGKRDLIVTTTAGSTTKAQAFEVLGLPVITSVVPNEVAQGTNVALAINGDYLNLGTVTVNLGSGITVNSLTQSDTQIVANITVDANANLGPRTVKVTNEVGTREAQNKLTVVPSLPVITSVTPSRALQDQTIDVTLGGRYFNGATSLSFGDGIAVNSFSPTSDNQMTARIAISAGAVPGKRSISVTTLKGTGVIPNGFEVFELVDAVIPDPGQTVWTTKDQNLTFSGTTVDVAGFVVGRVEYRIDGVGEWTPVDDFTRDTNSPTNGRYTFDAFLDPGRHTVEIRALDAAGNVVGRESEVSVTVKEGSRLWLIPVIIVAVLVIGAAAGLLIWKFRGKIGAEAKGRLPKPGN